EDGSNIGGLGPYELRWHSDQSYRTRPATGAVFYALEIAVAGVIRVLLTLEPGSQMVRLNVNDNGPGIPAAKHELIFDRFTQISDSQQGKPEGSGLGLYISRTIVEQCGGSLMVDKAYTSGAGFIVLLPRQEHLTQVGNAQRSDSDAGSFLQKNKD
ncbi:MAG: ATP-binding protein, partial [Bacteroidota bacterium]